MYSAHAPRRSHDALFPETRTSTIPTARFVYAAFGTLILFGCLLRFWKLSGVGLWYDELWTVVGSSDRPFMEMYREWILGDSHPPGYSLFYFLWLKVFPSTEFWSRLPNAVAGVITVAYLFFGTGKVLSRDERFMSASLASLSYGYIFYALSVKQYSAMLLFATIATIAYLEIATARRIDRRAGITLTAACIGLAHLNYFAMMYACTLLALLAATLRRDRAQLRIVGRIALVFALAYLPIAYFLYLQLAYAPGEWQVYEVKSFLVDLWSLLLFHAPGYVTQAFGVLFVALLVAGIMEPETRARLWSQRNRHIAAIAGVFLILMLALGVSKPIFFARYFLVIFPAALLGLGIVMAALFPVDRGWLVILPLAFFVYAAVIQFRAIDGLERQQWDKSVDLVLASRKPHDALYVLGARPDKTGFEYLQEGNVDGYFYVRNIKFYEYYFKRRGALEVAASLRVAEPTVESATDLTTRFRNSGTTVYVLAGHHLEYDDKALAALEAGTRGLTITRLFSTIVYKLTF